MYLITSVVGVIILFVLLIFLLRQPVSNDSVQSTTLSASPATQASLESLSTIEAERTSIAIFTQNPTLALSSTPFYAEIIYKDVIRNLTEMPLPNRSCYLSPTNVPSGSTAPINECGPFIATRLLADEPRETMRLMEEVGIEGTVGIESYGLEQINNSDNRSFVAVQSRMGISINVDEITDQKLINDIVKSLVDILVQHWNQLSYVSTNATILIEIKGSDQSKWIDTTYTTLYEAHENSLEGENLIQAIGGFTESN